MRKKLINKILTFDNIKEIIFPGLWMLLFSAYNAKSLESFIIYKAINVTSDVLLDIGFVFLILLYFRRVCYSGNIVNGFKDYCQNLKKRLPFWEVYNMLAIILVIPLVVGSERLIGFINIALVPLMVVPLIVRNIIFNIRMNNFPKE